VKIEIELGPKLYSFISHQEWLRFTNYQWRKLGATQPKTICVDQAGRVCRSAGHFFKALTENQFPVDVYAMRKDQVK
jgi:hypothetical protein